ncbi:hypothetical protein DPX16_0422 [Anabarilius grahami]|uniref:Uncharacterized protein n=1 Tax=Anabarilius grahami TaxID=495550 RepID=A0A3N0Z2W7_ANAGA|nr:hypothetical protein DPX16_0422 [Anabarilius grahami]
MDIMNVTCAEIQTEDGFEFRVSSDRFTQFSEFECEQLWYSKLRMDTMFRDVLDEVTPSLQLSDQLWWLFALFVIIFIIFICFMLRKRIFRGKRGSFVSVRMIQNSDLVKVVSDDPRSLQESETVRCPDDNNHLML